MEENTSFWNKTQDELTVSESLKFVALLPIVSITAIVAPLYVVGKINEIRAARKLKKQAKLAIVEDTTVEE